MKSRYAIALMTLASASMAQAQTSDTDQGEVTIGGIVTPICILGDPSASTVNLGQLINLSGPRTGKIIVVTSRTVTMPGSFCNYANSKVTVDATALTEQNGSPVATGFARAVNFTATVSPWASAEAAATTAASVSGATPTATGSSATQPLPQIADLSLTLSGFTVPTDALLVAGNYTGNIVVTLGPANP